MVVPATLERFTFFLIGLIDLDDSAILIFFEYFSKDSYMPKNVVSKNKANYKLMLLVHKEKNYQEIIKIILLQKFLFKYCFINNSNIGIFDSSSKKFPNCYIQKLSLKRTLLIKLMLDRCFS